MIDSFLTDDQRMIRDAALPDEVVRQLGELGLLGMIVPAEWGGTFSDYVAYALAIEEIAVGCASYSTLMAVHNSVGCEPILAFGTEAQKAEYLPKLATGEMIGAFCLTESQAGSEANNLKTRAIERDGQWVLSGAKQFTTNGARGHGDCVRCHRPRVGGRRVCPRSSCPRIHRVLTLGGPSTRWAFVLPILARFHSRTARFLQATCWARAAKD